MSRISPTTSLFSLVKSRALTVTPPRIFSVCGLLVDFFLVDFFAFLDERR